MFKRVYAIAFLIVISFASCKKDKATSGNDTPTPTTNRAELTKDSIFLYAKQVYLWNDAIPEYSVVKPRNFNSSSNQLDNFNTLLFRLTQYKINPTTGRAYEFYDFNDDGRADEPKFSYIEDLVASGQIAIANPKKSSVDLNGEGNDTGLNIGFYSNQTTSISRDYFLIIRYVNENSSAALNKLNRGDTILTINGKTYGANFDQEAEEVVGLLDLNTITVTGKKRGTGISFNYTLNKTNYNSSPILKDTVFTETGGKKVGYVAYARFSSQNNSIPALNGIFTKFSNDGVTDLIVDLRYNGGGFVSTAEHLVNLIIPSQHNGKKMFSEFFNATMREGKATILKNQPIRDQEGNSIGRNYFQENFSVSQNTYNIQKNGGLTNVNRVVFITGPGTASSSELVINSLKPYLGANLKIVGEPTYGKPVGFFPIRIDKYDVYFSMFETQNSLEQGAYYDGFVPDFNIGFDDIRWAFGDKGDIAVAQSLNFIKNGSFSSSNIASTKGASVSSSSLNSMKSLDTKDVFSREFKGMIDYPGRR
ncbi:S41 family peptidase [Pedobacter glucosidilyticus]|uniref:S41 family peptidase n=1 Tax=Pedobacter glucosidilyticus TaxID=1122941 RepID=UPI0026ED63BF|nr:S41 family peptidase [Pedobacter glucosidilyticus]